MSRFLCVQRNLSGQIPAAKPSPAEMQEMYSQFRAWQEQFKDNLVDMGGRLGNGRMVVPDSADGPFVEVKELIGGFMIVEADTLDRAVEVARGCPGLVRPGSGVEVIEIRSA